MDWTAAFSAVTASFLASLVEVVEAFTIVLAVSVVRGPRQALLGGAAALATLAVLVIALGPLFTLVPLHGFQIVIGILLLLFGMRWLRKAILRAAGIIALHDEDKAFAEETDQLSADAKAHAERADFLAMATAYKAVLLEGVEVVFIVLAVGGARGLIGAASLGALAAVALVAIVGVFVHKPLSAVPENALKYVVGVMLSAFGTFWVVEGLGGVWPLADLAIPLLAGGYALVGWSAVALIGRREPLSVAR